MGIWKISAGELLRAGGPIMIPIVFCSIVALAVVIEKWWQFAAVKTDVRKFKSEVFGMVRANRLKEAVAYCERSRSPVAAVLKAGILHFGEPRESIKEAMEDVSLFEIPRLESRFNVLATIAHITPLLGLLGTVTGMTGSFHTIQVRASSLHPVTPADLAGNIWEALLTTVAGLIVAIPTFVVYNYFVSRVNGYVLDMERAGTELVYLLCQRSPLESLDTGDGPIDESRG